MMPWKAALLTALNNRSRGDLFYAVLVAATVALIDSFRKGLGSGLLLGVWVGVMVFVFDVVADARKARKRARLEASRVPD